MLEKGKITSFQMGALLYPTVLASGFLVLPSVSAQYANNDFWLTGILSSVLGLVTVYAALRLHAAFPKQTVIEYSERIVGKIPGKLIGLVFFLFCLQSNGVIVRHYAEFVRGNFLFKTPILVVICSMVLLAAFAVRGGVEMVARVSVVLIPCFIFPILLLLLLAPDLDVKNIFPVLERGLMPVIKGTVAPQAWVSEYFLMTFFLPYLADPEKGRKWSIVSLGLTIASMTYVNLMILLLLGPDTASKLDPVLIAFRNISLADFIENLDALLLAMWVFGNFLKVSVFYYATVTSFAQWFKLSDYRPFVFPLGILSVALSLWGIPNFSVLATYSRVIAPIEILIVMTGIPLLLLTVSGLSKKRAR